MLVTKNFKATSEACEDHVTQNDLKTDLLWPNHPQARVVHFMPYVNRPNLGIYNDTVFPSMPTELMNWMKLISPDPEAWFVGQFAVYLLRPTDSFKKELGSN